MGFSSCNLATDDEQIILNSSIEGKTERFKACFLLHPTLLKKSTPRNARRLLINTCRRRVNSMRRTTAASVRCKQESGKANASELEGEIREMLKHSLPATPVDKKELQESDRRVLDGITESGATKMNEIVKNMNDELNEIQDGASQRATEMIQKETDILLEKYEQKRVDILEQVKTDRQVIQKEISNLEGLETEMKRDQGQKPISEKFLFASTMAFTIGALFYAWNGLVNSDASALSNAAVDASVAAVAGYFISRRRT